MLHLIIFVKLIIKKKAIQMFSKIKKSGADRIIFIVFSGMLVKFQPLNPV